MTVDSAYVDIIVGSDDFGPVEWKVCYL
jgi:hypothetical protein